MKPNLLTTVNSFPSFANKYLSPFPRLSSFPLPPSPPLSLRPSSYHLSPVLSSKQPLTSSQDHSFSSGSQLGRSSSEVLCEEQSDFNIQVGNPAVPSFVLSSNKLSLSDQAFFLLTFIACTTSIAFTSLVIAAVPTLYAMGRAATSLAKLADTAREELPGTMAAIRLSGMEISDLTLELSDLSQEIADGVNKSAQAVQAAEAGIRQLGAIAHQRTVSMIQETGNLPVKSIKPVVTGAAERTSRAVGQATKSLLDMISRARLGNGDDNELDRVDI